MSGIQRILVHIVFAFCVIFSLGNSVFAQSPDVGPTTKPVESAPATTDEKGNAASSEDSATAAAKDNSDGDTSGKITKNPTLRKESSPVYPPLALEQRMEAVVTLELEIGVNGLMEAVSVNSVHINTEAGKKYEGEDVYGFETAALIAGNLLEFHPAEVAGKPVVVQVSYTYRFRLPKKSTPPVVPDRSPPPSTGEDKPAVINFYGVLVERGTRSFVSGVKVTVYKGEGESLQGFETDTDADGRFAFYDLAPGTWNVLAEMSGYIPFKTTESILSGQVVEAKYYFERGSYNPYDVTIEAERPRKEVNRRSLRGADIEKVPGTLGDPVLVVENLPGVARTLGGEIIVRGSGPTDTGVFIDGTRVPLIYHFGGLKSVFPAKIIEGIDFYPGNFSAAYGRGMGGVFDLHIKKLEPDRFHGSLDVSVLDTSLYLEMPVTETVSVGLAGRRSYIDYVLDAVIPEDSDVGLISAPRYYDYQFFGSWRPAPKHDIRWLAMGSDDVFRLVSKKATNAVNAGAKSNEVSLGTAFQRLTGDYRFTPSESVKNHLKLSMGRDTFGLDVFGFLGAEFTVLNFSLRDTLSYQVHKNVNIDVGVDLEAFNSTGVVILPPAPREGTTTSGLGTVIETKFDNEKTVMFAPYLEADIRLAGLTIVPGLRVDYFGQANAWSVDPRLVLRYDHKTLAVKGGVAVVHQAPTIPDLDEKFGNPELGLLRAYQYSLGGEWSLTDFLVADVTFFYKDMRDLVSASSDTVTIDDKVVPEKLNNGGRGRVYGAEVFLEHSFANNIRGWISYTLSRAERKDSGSAGYRLFDYDQTHIFAAVASYILPRNWEIGLRWRYVSGNLHTPFVGGIFNNDDNRYRPILGEVNSARMPDFHQLDLRVDKTWIFDTWKISTYLSLINAYNRANPESINYNFDYTKQNYTTGLPVIPILGVKGEW